MSEHRHRTPLRGTSVVPRPKAGDPQYTDVNYRYAGQTGHIHEVVEIGGRELAKVGFDDRKIVYYFLDDLDREETAPKRTFHDLPEDSAADATAQGDGEAPDRAAPSASDDGGIAGKPHLAHVKSDSSHAEMTSGHRKATKKPDRL